MLYSSAPRWFILQLHIIKANAQTFAILTSRCLSTSFGHMQSFFFYVSRVGRMLMT